MSANTGGNSRSREFWIKEVSWILKNYCFIFSTIYHDIQDPGGNTKLLAKIDIDRALGSGCKTVEEIIEFLNMEGEDWFYGF